jgi:hypothetical protein
MKGKELRTAPPHYQHSWNQYNIFQHKRIETNNLFTIEGKCVVWP